MHIYMTDLAKGFLLLIYAPLALLLIYKLSQRLPACTTKKRAAITLMLFIGVLIPTWDVLYRSWEMKGLCEMEYGVNVYETARVDGFFMAYGTDVWIKKYGFEYTEIKDRQGDYFRLSKLGSQINRVAINTPKSRYELTNPKRELLSSKNKIRIRMILDRQTNKVLSEEKEFYAFPGWIDRILFSYLDPPVFRCVDAGYPNIKYSDLVTRTLIPTE